MPTAFPPGKGGNELIAGRGEMGALIRALDWSRTPLGPVASWPKSLVHYVRMVLDLPTPAIIFWGEDQTQLYNEGYAVIMGPRHPKYFGGSYRECWPDTYPLIYPWMRKVLDHGEVIRVDREHITVTRYGFNEEAYFTFTFSPLRNDAGEIAGIYQPVMEVTESVLAARRAETLRSLAPRPDSADAARDAMEVLSANPRDVPFALVFLNRGGQGQLELAAQTEALRAEGARVDKLKECAQRTFDSNAVARIDDLAAVFGRPMSLAPWPEPVGSAFLVPLRESHTARPTGVIVLGLSPRLHFNEQYREFMEAVAIQIANSLTAVELRAAAEREQEKLHRLFTQAPAVIALLRGPEHVYEFTNPRHLDLVGREVVGKPVKEALPELVSQGFIELLDQVYRTGERLFGKEVPAMFLQGPAKGQQVYLNFVYEPSFGPSGKVEGVMAFAFEVTDQVLARRKVEEAERRATLIAEAVPVIVWTLNPDGQADFYNQRWHEYTGLSPGTLGVDGWRSITHPDDLAAIGDSWAASVSNGVPFEATVRLRRGSDGAYRWHLARAYPLKDRNGAILKWVGSATDIDDQKHAEENTRFLSEASAALTASLDYEDTLRRVAQLAVPRLADWCTVHVVESDDTLPRRIAVMHRDPEKVRWAEEVSRRYPPDIASEHGLGRVIRSGQPEVFAHVPEDLLEAAAKDAEHLRMLRALGMRSAMILPLVARGRVLGAISFIAAESGRSYSPADVAVAQELADRAATAVENARLYNEAQEAVRVRDDFLSIASHELKTPLTPLQLHLQAIQRSGNGAGRELSPQRLASKLETIGRQVNRLESLVNSLLDISRIAGRRLQVEREDIDLSEVIRETLSRFGEDLQRSGSSLDLKLTEPTVGCWDRLRLEQILTNLLSNAIKFGDGKPIEVALTAQSGVARLRVSDHGIGIAPQDQARIFERFERAVLTRHYGGFGLGLWITRQIVEALGGTIQVESELGKGAAFTVLLPLQQIHPATGMDTEARAKRAH